MIIVDISRGSMASGNLKTLNSDSETNAVEASKTLFLSIRTKQEKDARAT